MAKKRIDRKATDLARKIWRTVGECEAYDKCKSQKEQPQLQGAHIYGVGAYPRLKDDLRNGMSLCATCHRYYTSAPLDFTEFVEGTKYKKYLQPLRDKQNGPKVKVFWEDRLAFLQDVYKQIMDGEMTVDDAREYEND
jgi:hypothetical protein